MTEDELICRYEDCTSAIVSALRDVSVIERLRFVASVLAQRSANPEDAGYDPMTPVITQVLHDSIEVLVEKVPNIHKIRYGSPKPGLT